MPGHSMTKTHRPDPAAGLIARRRLIGLLTAEAARPLVILAAPAGFGKSTLLIQYAQALEAEGRTTAWAAADGDDRDVRAFLALLVRALANAALDLDDMAVGAADGFAQAHVTAVTDRLVERLAAAPARLSLFIDDYHMAETPEANAVLERLLREAGGRVHIALGCRHAPALDLATLFAEGRAVEIGPDHLRMTADETRTLLGEAFDAGELSAIAAKAEGWPIALQLIKARRATNPHAPVGEIVSSELISAYLTRQITSVLDPPLRDFLFRIAVLGKVTAELADHVADDPAPERTDDAGQGGATNAWAMLAALQPFRALLVPLDRDGQWFRLHHLFAEHLQKQLKCDAPAVFRRILTRAAHWHAERGYNGEAVRCAAAAGDYALAGALIRSQGGWRIILWDGITPLRTQLAHLPPAVVQSDRALCIARGYLHCKDGQIAQARTCLSRAAALPGPIDQGGQASESAGSGGTGGSGGAGDIEPVLTMLHLYEDLGTWPDGAPPVAHVIARAEAHAPLDAGTLLAGETLDRLRRGRLADAVATERAATHAMKQCGSILGLNYCAIHAGTIALYRGQHDAAEAAIQRALDLARENFGLDSGLIHLATVLDLAVRTWAGTARDSDLPRFRRMFDHILDHDGWSEIYLVGVDALVHLALLYRRHELATQVLDQVQDYAARRDLDRLACFVRCLRAKHAWVTGRTDAAWEELAALGFQYGAHVTGTNEDAVHWQSAALFLSLRAAVDPAGGGAEAVADLAGMEALARRLEDTGRAFHAQRLWAALGRALDRAGQPRRSRTVLARALGAVTRHGLPAILAHDGALEPYLADLRDLCADDPARQLDRLTLDRVDRLLATREGGAQALLSRRERDVLDQLAQGQSNKEIARVLALTENTVKFHLKSIYAKLGVQRRGEAVAKARARALLQ
ncbi:LuxR C-terminal-related transcriptional regulator [Rhodothalassium salexigens]|uniref:LuxR C-terminal-related transcriptional regulator n=2 Tax=Rhodothalassium salexigens TaxID=1086 RepID=UPI001F5E28BF|nr:LuxR C-terminal-related transcriptional regulator [Rhodothalassium salexigens]